MLKLFLTTTLVSFSLAIPSASAAPLRLLDNSLNSASTKSLPTNVRYRPSGKEQLKRLLRPHIGGVPITQAVRDATGDPNIVVFDRRSPNDDVYICSYITYRGKRAMVCD